MEIISLSATTQKTAINRACEVLAQGGLILFPTETTYGAGVDATNPAGVAKLLSYKARREGKPLSIAVPDQALASEFVELNESAQALYQQFLPGPVTVVSLVKPSAPLAAGVASEFGTLGVRIPDYPWLLELLRKYGRPITATSANASGKKRPYTIQTVLDNLSTRQKNLIDLVVDAGQLPPNPPSTVIDTTFSAPVTLRPGELAVSADQSATILHSSSEAETIRLAGTLLLKHWQTITTKGLVVGLEGALGAGKTTFTKGVAQFLQIEYPITSPTYTYVEEYVFERHKVWGKLFHLDAWRVENETEFKRLGFESLLRPKAIVVVEWWNRVQAWTPPDLPMLRVVIEDQADTHRQLSIYEHHITPPGE